MVIRKFELSRDFPLPICSLRFFSTLKDTAHFGHLCFLSSSWLLTCFLYRAQVPNPGTCGGQILQKYGPKNAIVHRTLKLESFEFSRKTVLI